MALPPALRHSGFRGYLAGSFVSNAGNSLQAAALSLHVYQLTGSSLMVGLMGLVRVVPLVALTLFGGVLADHADRRKVMLLTQSGMALVALLAFALTYTGSVTVGGLYLVVALNAIARAFDGPARQAMFFRLVPRKDFANAASLNAVTWQACDVVGPVLAGFLIAGGGLGRLGGYSLCYGLNFASFAAVMMAVWWLPPCLPESTSEAPKSFGEVFQRIGDGLQFVNRTPVVRQAMWVDFWATLWSGANALIPAMSTSILGLDARGYGLLRASSAIGAGVAALALSALPTIRRQGRVVVIMIGFYGLFTIAFGFSNSLWTASLSLALVGASDMISTVMRQTIRQLTTPDELRGRMNATSSLFHISGPQLGDAEAGAAAALWGERVSIVLGGGLCLFVAAHWSQAKALVQYRHGDHEAQEGYVA